MFSLSKFPEEIEFKIEEYYYSSIFYESLQKIKKESFLKMYKNYYCIHFYDFFHLWNIEQLKELYFEFYNCECCETHNINKPCINNINECFYVESYKDLYKDKSCECECRQICRKLYLYIYHYDKLMNGTFIYKNPFKLLFSNKNYYFHGFEHLYDLE
jgi:hypothetical protein